MTSAADIRQIRTVTADGRVVIPFIFQLALGVENGGQVVFVLENGGVTIRAAEIRKAPTPVAAERPSLNSAWADIKAELNELIDASSKGRVSEPERIIE